MEHSLSIGVIKNMKAKAIFWIRTAACCILAIAALNAFGLGSDYPDHQPVGGTSGWPSGMTALVNTTNRVHGFFVNAEDVFFFSGTATNMSEFLLAYSRLQGVEKHCLILHDGTGDAKSSWSTNGQACDWKLYGCPKGWHNIGTPPDPSSAGVLKKAASKSDYILEIHFWTGGPIALDKVSVPKNVEVRKETKS